MDVEPYISDPIVAKSPMKVYLRSQFSSLIRADGS